jgi:hypothetical protein
MSVYILYQRNKTSCSFAISHIYTLHLCSSLFMLILFWNEIDVVVVLMFFRCLPSQSKIHRDKFMIVIHINI